MVGLPVITVWFAFEFCIKKMDRSLDLPLLICTSKLSNASRPYYSHAHCHSRSHDRSPEPFRVLKALSSPAERLERFMVDKSEQIFYNQSVAKDVQWVPLPLASPHFNNRKMISHLLRVGVQHAAPDF
jgi:hypothetical protein